MKTIRISDLDNVAVALHPIAEGEEITAGGITVKALMDIPQGHKIALLPIKKGENVVKYGFPIGHATEDAAPGTWMHTHNVHTNLSGEVEYSYKQKVENHIGHTGDHDHAKSQMWLFGSYKKALKYILQHKSRQRNAKNTSI